MSDIVTNEPTILQPKDIEQKLLITNSNPETITNIGKRSLVVGGAKYDCITGLDAKVKMVGSIVLKDFKSPTPPLFYDKSHKLIDVKDAQIVSIEDIGDVFVDGKKFRLSSDYWGNPCLYPNEIEPANPSLVKAVKQVVHIYETASEQPDKVIEELKKIIDIKTVDEMIGIVKFYSDNPSLQNIIRLSRAGIDYWSLARIKREERPQYFDDKLGYVSERIKESGQYENIMNICEKIASNTPLTKEEAIMIAATDSPITYDGILDRTFKINHFTEPYVLANMVEQYLMRQAMPKGYLSEHQSHFSRFKTLMESKGYSFLKPIMPYSGTDTATKAQEGSIWGNTSELFLGENRKIDSVSLANLLDHEALHKNGAGEEGFTESLAVIMRNNGNIEQAIKDNFLSSIKYKTKVDDLLRIVQRINTSSADPYLGIKLLLDGLNTDDNLTPIRKYYDEKIAQTKGGFDALMERYSQVVPHYVRDVDMPNSVSTPVLSALLPSIQISGLTDRLLSSKSEFYTVEELEQRITHDMALIQQNPLIILAPDATISGDISNLIFSRILANNQATIELHSLIGQQYKEKAAAIKKTNSSIFSQ